MALNDGGRFVCVALIVTVEVDSADSELLERLGEADGRASVVDIVSAEINSNLESVSYVCQVSVIPRGKEVRQ